MTMDYVSTGIIVILVATVAYGGSFILRVLNGRVAANHLQRSYFRAGHAHAGVLLILGLLLRMLLADPAIPGWGRAFADGVLYAAVLMPAGFFLSVVGRDPQEPNRLRWLIGVGGVVLAAAVVGSGVALIVAGH